MKSNLDLVGFWSVKWLKKILKLHQVRRHFASRTWAIEQEREVSAFQCLSEQRKYRNKDYASSLTLKGSVTKTKFQNVSFSRCDDHPGMVYKICVDRATLFSSRREHAFPKVHFGTCVNRQESGKSSYKNWAGFPCCWSHSDTCKWQCKQHCNRQQKIRKVKARQICGFSRAMRRKPNEINLIKPRNGSIRSIQAPLSRYLIAAGTRC